MSRPGCSTGGERRLSATLVILVNEPITYPSGWHERSRLARFFESLPFVGDRAMLGKRARLILLDRDASVLRQWDSIVGDEYDVVENVLKPIHRNTCWPNHYFLPVDSFLLLCIDAEICDVLNDICLESGIGDRGRNRLLDWLMCTDAAPRWMPEGD